MHQKMIITVQLASPIQPLKCIAQTLHLASLCTLKRHHSFKEEFIFRILDNKCRIDEAANSFHHCCYAKTTED